MALSRLLLPRLIRHNFSRTGMSRHPRGLVVHIAQCGTLNGIHSWFNNPNQTIRYPRHGTVVEAHVNASASLGVNAMAPYTSSSIRTPGLEMAGNVTGSALRMSDSFLMPSPMISCEVLPAC